MQLTLPQSIDMGEILRYLGYRGGAQPDASTLQQIGSACAEILSAAQARGTHCTLDRAQAAYLFAGDDIARHLAGCQGCVLLAVTLGAGVDMLLRRAQAHNITRAVLLDTAASVLVEQIANEAEAQLRAQIAASGGFLTGRFSPGYGDYPITVQGALLQALDAPRRIGLAATDTHLLTPRKSITAVCGTADHPVTGRAAGCATCALREKCTYRKEGKNCAG